MSKLTNWFLTSNRYKHFLYAIPVGATLTALTALGLAGGMEYKDKLYGNKWDWLDFVCTVAGGLLGNAITWLIIYFCIFV